MALANLLNLPIDGASFAIFAFTNANEHLKINEEIFRVFDVSLDLPILDPIPLRDIDTWLNAHQRIHDLQNATLGLFGSDLSALDIEDRGELVNWIRTHFEEHRAAAAALELD